MPLAAHPGSLLRRELRARELSANRLALDLGVPSGRITDILNGRRSITADTALRLGRYFGNRAQFWLDLQTQHDIGPVNTMSAADQAPVFPLRRGCIGEARKPCEWRREFATVGQHHEDAVVHHPDIDCGGLTHPASPRWQTRRAPG